MSQRVTGNTRTFDAGENLSLYRLVDLDGSGDAIYSGAASVPVGSTEYSENLGRPIAVLLRNGPGTRIYTSSVAITKGESVYPDASGKITNVVGAVASVGQVLASVGSDEYVEVLPM